MKKYIEYYRLIKNIYEEYGKHRAYRAIVDAPAEDVEEVRHSEWRLLKTRTFADGGYCSTFECPLCGREVSTQHAYDEDKYEYAKTSFPYCHCGAKMDGKREK